MRCCIGRGRKILARSFGATGQGHADGQVFWSAGGRHAARDHRYERFQQPRTADGLQKLPQLGFYRHPRGRWCKLPCALCSIIPA